MENKFSFNKFSFKTFYREGFDPFCSVGFFEMEYIFKSSGVFFWSSDLLMPFHLSKNPKQTSSRGFVLLFSLARKVIDPRLVLF